MAPQARGGPVKSWEKLKASITPILPGGPERIPWEWYDTQTYTSGTTTRLEFFQNTNNDKVLSNMQAAGQIPAPMFFEIHHISVCYLLPMAAPALAAAPAEGGAFTDISNLGRGRGVLEIAQKSYFEAPQLHLPCGGGPDGAMASVGAGSVATVATQSFANNGRPDLRNRYCIWGDIVIPHNQNFTVVLTWTAAITLEAGNTLIKTILDGYLYRRVL